MASNSLIPEISDDDLRRLCKRIGAVVNFPKVFLFWRGEKYFIKPVNPRSVAFTWNPKRAKRAKGLGVLRDIRTYHAYAYYGLFKPTIAEVIAQIPKELLDQVVAFEIIKHPETVADLNKEQEALDAGYHVATTRLYSR
ncbi:MAG: hypothetical protein ABID64_00945 [Nitrospirota bacterium]